MSVVFPLLDYSVLLEKSFLQKTFLFCVTIAENQSVMNLMEEIPENSHGKQLLWKEMNFISIRNQKEKPNSLVNPKLKRKWLSASLMRSRLKAVQLAFNHWTL